jgi:hypothetical protein
MDITLNKLEYYKRRYTRAYSIFTQWISILQACQHYCVPHRDLFYYTNYTQGAQKNGKVYDTTQVAAGRSFTSKLQGTLTPPGQVWAILEAGTDFDEEDKVQVNEYLQYATDTIFNYIQHSNFDLAINECYYDLLIGTACLQINPADDQVGAPFICYSIPLAQLCFEESINGYIESAYRTWGEVRISEIQIMWPNAKLPQWMLEQLRMDPNSTIKNLYEGVIYVHGDKLPFKYVLWIDSDILLEEEDVSGKWIIFRWSKVNNEIFGRGVAMEALPSIMSLQEIFRLELTSANLNVCKPYMAYSDGVFNPWTFRIEANTVIPVSPTSGGEWPIAPLPDVANPNFMQLTAQDLRNQINKLMFSEPLGDIKDSTKTATELALRQRQLAEEIGPAFTRLQQEFMSKVIQRIIHILQGKGLLEPLKINGNDVQLRYQSPLVVAQGHKNVEGYVEYVQVIQSIMGPEIATIMQNPIEVPVWIGEQLNINKKLLPDKERIKQFLQQKSDELNQLQQGAINEQRQGSANPGG